MPSFAFGPNSDRLFVTLDTGIGVFDASTGERLNWPPDQQPPGQQADQNPAEPQPRRDQYLLGQIEGLLKESEALQLQGRREEARQHRDKAVYRAQQLAEFLRETPVPDTFSQELIANGSFERATMGKPPRNIETLLPGSNVIAGWQTFDPTWNPHGKVQEGDVEQTRLIVDWIGPGRWKASHGYCSLDIDGGISQSVATEAGITYALTFDMAGNPETDYPIQQFVRVEIAGRTHEFHFDATRSTKDNLRWTNRTVIFEAADSLTTIRLLNAKPNVHSAGVALDNVSLHRLDPAIATQAQELFCRIMRFDREAEELKAAGRVKESRQHTEAAARYRQQLQELMRPTKACDAVPVVSGWESLSQTGIADKYTMLESVTELPFNRHVGIRKATTESGLLELPAGGHFLNHLGTVHAGAQLALAEASSGEFLLQSLKDESDVIRVVRRVEAKFRKPANGRITATASTPSNTVDNAQSELAAKGRSLLTISVDLHDESG